MSDKKIVYRRGSLEHRARMSEVMRKVYQDPEFVPPSENDCARMSARARARWRDPEYRASVSAGIREWWARKRDNKESDKKEG
jgi:hypothetical protein